MKLQAIASSIAIVGAMAFAMPATAQDLLLRGEQIPVDQVDNFKEACEGLRAANTASLTTSDDQTDDDVDPTETGSIDPADTSGSPDPAAQEKWDELMATLTIEECDAAGL